MNKIRFFGKDYQSYFWSPRLLVFVLFQLTMIHFYLREVIQFSMAADYPIAPWVVIFLFQNPYMQFVYGISVVYFFSTVPFFRQNQMYVIIRQGRERWLRYKIGRVWLSAVLLTALEILLSVLLLIPHIEWTADWGKVFYSLAMTDAASQFGVKIPVRYEVLVQYTPAGAMMQMVIRMMGVTGFIGMLMFWMSVQFSRTLAAVMGSALAVMSIVVVNMHYQISGITYSSPFSWLNILELEQKGRAGYKGMLLIIGIVAAGTLLCVTALRKKIKKIDFVWMREG